jgi:hypothetical protein
MTVVTITENPRQGKERKHLSARVGELNKVLWREIKRGPADPPSTLAFAHVVAETIARDYTMSPIVQNHLIRLGLVYHLMGLLGPEEARA